VVWPSLFCERWVRWNSPYINHFLSADTVIPSYTNPQDLNRYSYVNNNPLSYTDPTGHMRVEEAGGKRGCSDPKYCQNGKPKPPKKGSQKGKEKDSKGCKTVTCNALRGDLKAIGDLVLPTHVGWRIQGELSATMVQILGGAGGFGPSGTLGANVVYNRTSGELGVFADFTVEGGGSIGTPIAGSVTTGPIVGWGSSTIKDVAQGNSAIVSGTAAYEGALSASISIPIDGNSLNSIRPHVDPVYGQIPATLFMGGGVGYAYGGLGGGASHVFVSTSTDLSP
jgi:hypothetical protein